MYMYTISFIVRSLIFIFKIVTAIKNTHNSYDLGPIEKCDFRGGNYLEKLYAMSTTKFMPDSFLIK